MPNDVTTKLTDEAYWDGFWRNPFGATASHLSFHFYALSRALRELAPAGSSAIELGCGGSVWVPMLASRGVDSWGIDYSSVGVDATMAALARWGVRAQVIQGDVFDQGLLPADRFDVVYSLGLLEHFTDGAPLLNRCREITKPGGHVLTTVPNLAGWWGPLQRRLDRRIYDAHKVFTPQELDRVHVEAGLEVVRPAAYFGGFCPLLVNYNRVLDRMPRLAAKATLAGLWATQQLVCWASAPLPQPLSNPSATAGHILGAYRRPL